MNLPPFARWMSRRNGQSLAQVFSKRLQKLAEEFPGLPSTEHWKRVLESRTGWQRVREGAYRFRTGESVEVKPDGSPKELLARITAVEVKPLAAGMAPDLQRVLEEEAVSAAVAWWEERRRTP